MRKRILECVAIAALGATFAAGVFAQQNPPAKPAKASKPAKQGATADLAFQPGLEPHAIDLLKAASARLAAAKSMGFTAVVSYEGPSLLGPPLIYSTKSEVTLRRPGVAVGATVASANTAAATANAYNAGVAAGASSAFTMGAIYATLPAGAVVSNVYGQNYYLVGNTWFLPAYGANGVYYRVVPAP